MSVSFSDILCNRVSIDIDDIRWKEELEENAALFFREKSLYVINGISRFNRPPEIVSFLSYTAPTYDDFYYTSDVAQPTGVTIQTGKIGFDLCNVGLIGTDSFNVPYYTPAYANYDANTGDVTLTDALTEGQQIQIDFYSDGFFNNDLTDRQQRILGLCIAYDWLVNFSNTYLNLQNKIIDKSFQVKSENENIKAINTKIRETRASLDSELAAYEQYIMYQNVIPNYLQAKILP